MTRKPKKKSKKKCKSDDLNQYLILTGKTGLSSFSIILGCMIVKKQKKCEFQATSIVKINL